MSEFEIATSCCRLGQDGIVLPYQVCQEARHDRLRRRHPSSRRSGTAFSEFNPAASASHGSSLKFLIRKRAEPIRPVSSDADWLSLVNFSGSGWRSIRVLRLRPAAGVVIFFGLVAPEDHCGPIRLGKSRSRMRLRERLSRDRNLSVWAAPSYCVNVR